MHIDYILYGEAVNTLLDYFSGVKGRFLVGYMDEGHTF
jgi:hypothetical protein